jgi:small subunit ribosomal protein S2
MSSENNASQIQLNIPSVSIEDLLNAGVHYGHKTNRWNPDMKPYIYQKRSNIHIIDLRQTYSKMMEAMIEIYKTISSNKKILFVCTKQNLAPIVKEYAEKSGQFYITHRWLGGMMTNWRVVMSSIRQIPKLEKELQNSSGYKKKELVSLQKRLTKLKQCFGGMHGLVGRPDLVIVFHKQDYDAVNEATSLGIPVVAIADTNVSPKKISYPIPGNDDSPRSIELYCQVIMQTIMNASADSKK